MSVSTLDADGIAKAIAGYVHRGLRVVRLNGVVRAGECTCSKGGDCGSPGKHPTGSAWENTTDEDEVFKLWGGPKRFNVGVVLGDAGRGTGPAVIDIEADSDEAAAELRRLGLDRFETPTWSSGRGLHRLFLWSPALPTMQVVKPYGIEVRIGGGGKQTQSVMPPSMHHSGRAYQWQPGFGLDEVEIAALSDNVMGAILEEVRRGTSGATAGITSGRRATAILRGTTREGSRNVDLLSHAGLLVRAINPSDDEMEQVLLDVLRAVNTIRCRPPLADEEVKGVYRSALKYRREDTAAEALFPGVEAIVEGSRTRYRPAGLELTIHQGDPTMFELRCDALRPFNPSGSVRVPADVWGDPRRMKTALIAAFPGAPYDRHPGDFTRIWDGTAPQAATRNHPAREAVTGLRVLLEQEATAAGRRVEVTDPAENDTRRLVGLFVARLDYLGASEHLECRHKENVTIDEEIAEIIQSRSAGWVSGRMFFCWVKVWLSIGQINLVKERDKMKVSRVIPEIIGRALPVARPSFRKVRGSVRVLAPHELELLRTFAAGGAEPVMSNAYGACAGAPEAQKGVAGVVATQEPAATRARGHARCLGLHCGGTAGAVRGDRSRRQHGDGPAWHSPQRRPLRSGTAPHNAVDAREGPRPRPGVIGPLGGCGRPCRRCARCCPRICGIARSAARCR